MRMLPIVVSLVVVQPAAAAVYEVGPGKPHAAIGEVPWESLGAGDTVLIHHRPEPYREKWAIGNGGTADAPIVVSGVPGPGGELPVIEGHGATTRRALRFWSEGRGVIKIGGASAPGGRPRHIVLESLDVRGGRSGNPFTDSRGAAQRYAKNAAAVFVESGDSITVRGCALSGSSNGLFVANGTTDLVVEGNHIHGNGNRGDIYVHNSYVEAQGALYQFNRYDPLCDGCGGNNLKDRSAGTVVRYNRIEGGNRQLDLVEGSFTGVPAYRTTYVYGNLLLEREGDGNRQILHYGGDLGNVSRYRKGVLYFHHNTVVSTRSGRTTLMRLSTNGERADVRNNLVLVTAPGRELSLSDAAGHISLSRNWMKSGWVKSHQSLTGSVSEAAAQVEGEDPGLEDLSESLRPRADSPVRDAAGPLDPATEGHEPVLEYLDPQSGTIRDDDGAPDIGALEVRTPVRRVSFGGGRAARAGSRNPRRAIVGS